MTGRDKAASAVAGGEFAFIRDILAPLAGDCEAALGLADDAALIAPPAGRQMVVTKDMIVAGRHYPPNMPAALVGRRLLRVNLSDLAAMGARPEYFLLGLALDEDDPRAWLEDFASGLGADMERFGIALIGGDTVAGRGASTLSLTAIGSLAEGDALCRGGGRIGDDIYVSGTIGDGALGLWARQGGLGALGAAHRDYLSGRFELPQPRLGLGMALSALAHAAIDISDGLLADLGHLAAASGCAAALCFEDLPLSDAAAAALAFDDGRWETIVSGGDDYELLFAADPGKSAEIARLGAELGVRLSRIGTLRDGAGVAMTRGGDIVSPAHRGYVHFS